MTRIRPWREWSLRSRMVVVIAALAAVGLLAASISGTLLLRSYLVQRVDQQLGIEVRRSGKRVDLSPTEFNLLRYLLTNAGRVVSKAQILDRVWNYDFGGDGRIVESYVYYLRRKIDKWDPPLIHTVRGVGYALRLPRGEDE